MADVFTRENRVKLCDELKEKHNALSGRKMKKMKNYVQQTAWHKCWYIAQMPISSNNGKTAAYVKFPFISFVLFLFFCCFPIQTIHSEELNKFDELLVADSLASFVSKGNKSENELDDLLSRYCTTIDRNGLSFEQKQLSALFWAAKIQTDHHISFNNKNYLFQAETFAIRQNEVDFLVELLNEHARKYYENSEFNNAFSFYYTSYELIEYVKEDENSIDAFLGLAEIYQRFSHYKKAVEILLKASEMPILNLLKEKKYNLLVKLGEINYEIEDFKESIYFFNKSIALAKQMNNIDDVLYCYKELACVYKKQGDYNAALSTLFLAKQTPIKGITFQRLASYDREIGDVYLLNEEYQKAENHLKLSLEDAKRHNDKILEAKTLLSISALFLETNKLEQAKDSLAKCVRIADSFSDQDMLMNAYWIMHQIFENQHDFENSLRYLKLYVEQKDAIGYEETKKEIINTQIIFNRENSEKAIKNLEREKEKVSQSNQQINIRLWIVSAMLGLFFILILIIIYGLIQKNKTNKKLQKSNRELNEARTELLNKKEQLKEWNFKLEQQVALRTIELKEANEQLMQLDKVKSEFLEIISNDMRTPLSAVIGIAQLLNQTTTAEEQQEYLKNLIAASKQLLNFSDIALLITTLKTKNDYDEFQQILASYIVDSLQKQIATTIEKYNIRLKTHIAPENLLIYVDSILLIKSLKILLTSISNKTDLNGTIEINISGKATYNTIQIIAESVGFDQNELDEIILLSENKNANNRQSENLTITAVRIIQEIHKGSMSISRIDTEHFEVLLIFPKHY